MSNPQTTLRVMVVDDEPPARDLITQVLSTEPDLQIVAQCGSGKEALPAIRRLSPDLVFLDVCMPEMDGFQLISELTPDQRPLIVFVTAFDQFAVRAFETHAVDYLLKPFEYDRLRVAVRRARARLSDPDSSYQLRLSKLLEKIACRQPVDRMAIRDSDRTVFLNLHDISWIEAEGNYVRIHAGRNNHLLRETMADTESRLAVKGFVRINRSMLVNVDRIKELRPLFHGDATLMLDDGTTLPISRRYRQNLDSATLSLG